MFRFLGRVKTEPAVVVAIHSSGVFVLPSTQCEKSSGCKGGCAACITDVQRKRPRLLCPTSQSQSFSLGEKVEVTYYAVHEVVAATIIFGIPTVMLFAGVVVINQFNPMLADKPWGIAALCGCVGAGFCSIIAFEKAIHRFFPITIRKSH